MCARKIRKGWPSTMLRSGFFLSIILLSSASGFGHSNPTPITPNFSELIRVDSIYQKSVKTFEAYAAELYADLDEPELLYEMFIEGLTGYYNMFNKDELERPDILTLIDFSKPSSEPRFYIIDLCQRKVLHESIVSHGAGSGGLYAKHFSNEDNSHKSSLGFYRTTTTYSGKYKLALRLQGMEHSNSHASRRGVVMHGAKYASYEFLDKNGCRLGRSYGCPALPYEGFEQVVEWIKNGSCLYIYHPNKSYHRHSKYLERRSYLQAFISF